MDSCERIRVESTNLEEIGWEDGKLVVLFKSGAVYEYTGVPEEVFQGLLMARSVGQYFNENIRKAGFPYERLE